MGHVLKAHGFSPIPIGLRPTRGDENWPTRSTSGHEKRKGTTSVVPIRPIESIGFEPMRDVFRGYSLSLRSSSAASLAPERRIPLPSWAGLHTPPPGPVSPAGTPAACVILNLS